MQNLPRSLQQSLNEIYQPFIEEEPPGNFIFVIFALNIEQRSFFLIYTVTWFFIFSSGEFCPR